MATNNNCNECLQAIKKAMKIGFISICFTIIVSVIGTNVVRISKLEKWQKAVIKELAITQTRVDKLERIVIQGAQ